LPCESLQKPCKEEEGTKKYVYLLLPSGTKIRLIGWFILDKFNQIVQEIAGFRRGWPTKYFQNMFLCIKKCIFVYKKERWVLQGFAGNREKCRYCPRPYIFLPITHPHQQMHA